MAGDDDILDSSDGLTDAERVQFNEMQSATSGDAPAVDPGAGAADGAAADAGAADGADAAAAAAGAADAGVVAGKDGAAKDGAAADAGADDDDDEVVEAAVLGPDGKPALEADGTPKKGRRKVRVSLNKFNAEKERADKLDGELRTTRESMARYDERMRLLSEALTTPKVDPAKKEEDAEPDPEADVFGWINWSRAKTAKLEQAVQDMRDGKQTEDGQKVVADAYTQDAMALAGREPNFAPAYNHLMASRTQELAMYFFGVDLTDANARQLTQQEIGRIKSVAAEEERGIVENAIAQGRSPAQAVYQMSRYRGYVPRAAAANGANGAAHAGNGAAKPAANGKGAENGGKPNVADEIARIKAGTEAALSLSDGGASPANPMTPQKLADMPQEEFNAIMDRADPEEIKILFEGRA